MSRMHSIQLKNHEKTLSKKKGNIKYTQKILDIYVLILLMWTSAAWITFLSIEIMPFMKGGRNIYRKAYNT